jgi:hypothetical protein
VRAARPSASDDADADTYDGDDSFLAASDEGGTQQPPSQHAAACGVCGSGSGAMLACRGCPAASHPACAGARPGVRDWLCAVCADA